MQVLKKNNNKLRSQTYTEILNTHWKTRGKPLFEFGKKVLQFIELGSYKNVNMKKNQFKVFISKQQYFCTINMCEIYAHSFIRHMK